MRKYFYFIIVSIISLTLLGNSQASIDGIPLNIFPKDSSLKESLQLNSERMIGNVIVLPKDEFNQNEAASIITRIDQLPSSMLYQINEQRIRVKLFTGKLTDNPTAQHLKGLSPRGYESNKSWDDVPGIGGSKTVLVKIGHSEKGKGHGSVNLELHELAHSIDRHVYDEIRYNHRFLNIWKEEKNNLFPNRPYFLKFSEEYFAETFAMYYLGGEYREHLKQKAPRTYEFIKTLK